jgi:hypothetical protein
MSLSRGIFRAFYLVQFEVLDLSTYSFLFSKDFFSFGSLTVLRWSKNVVLICEIGNIALN